MTEALRIRAILALVATNVLLEAILVGVFAFTRSETIRAMAMTLAMGPGIQAALLLANSRGRLVGIVAGGAISGLGICVVGIVTHWIS